MGRSSKASILAERLSTKSGEAQSAREVLGGLLRSWTAERRVFRAPPEPGG